MLDAVSILRQTRANILDYVKDLDDARMLTIPAGLNNNILWNVGHAIVSAQLLCYKLSGLPVKIDESLIDLLRKGSSPADWTTPPGRAYLQDSLLSTVDGIERDYKAGLFAESFQAPYPTSYGVVLNSIHDALAFDNVHEALHFGTIRAINNVLKP